MSADLTTRLANFLAVLGTGSTAPSLTGVLTTSVTAVGNVGTGEDTLISYDLPANSLASNGQAIRVHAWGTFAGNTNAKELKFYFGSAVGIDMMAHTFVTATNLVTATWTIEALIVRTASNTQTIVAKMTHILGGTVDIHDVTMDRNIVAATETDTAAITIKCTGSATTDNDIVQSGLVVEGLM